jgi:hypothetical protein
MAGSHRAGCLNCLPRVFLNFWRNLISWRQLPVHLIMQRHFSAFVCSLQ